MIRSSLIRVLAAFIVVATAHPAARAAVLEWDATEVSIDAPPLAESVQATFSFKNATAQPLTIADVHSSCGCTVPELEKRTYAPGESGTIRAVFTLGDRVGLQEKAIRVTTAAPAASTTLLMLRVQIPKLFEVSPYFVVWNRGDPTTSKSIEVRILRPDILTLGSVESRHAVFQAKATPVGDAPDRLTVTITPESTENPLNGVVVVTMKTTAGEAHPVTLYALVRGTPAAKTAPAHATPER